VPLVMLKSFRHALLRIPIYPPMHSNAKPPTDSDLKPPGVPI
jgi:hypothetical protein